MRTTRRTIRTLAFGGLLALAAFTGTATAAEQCRDDKGRFIKCPVPATTSADTHCRDRTTKKFVKCGRPNSEVVPAPAK